MLCDKTDEHHITRFLAHTSSNAWYFLLALFFILPTKELDGGSLTDTSVPGSITKVRGIELLFLSRWERSSFCDLDIFEKSIISLVRLSVCVLKSCTMPNKASNISLWEGSDVFKFEDSTPLIEMRNTGNSSEVGGTRTGPSDPCWLALSVSPSPTGSLLLLGLPLSLHCPCAVFQIRMQPANYHPVIHIIWDNVINKIGSKMDIQKQAFDTALFSALHYSVWHYLCSAEIFCPESKLAPA